MYENERLTLFYRPNPRTPTLQERFGAGRSSCRCIGLPLLVLVTVGVVADSFDHNTGKIVPYPSTLHLKCNDAVSLRDFITVVSRFHHCIARSHPADVDGG